MVEIHGRLNLIQNEEKIKHINLEKIMKYVNKLHNTRRVERNWDLIKKENNEKIGFDPEKYGIFGEFYYKNDIEETIEDINNFGGNPSLRLPYYIEKNEKNEYFLKSTENPKGNNLDSSSGWLYFLHRQLFYHLGIETKGEFKITDFQMKTKAIVKVNNEGIKYKSNGMKEYNTITDKKIFLDSINKRERKKRMYYPYFFEEISKQIESKKLNEDYGFEP